MHGNNNKTELNKDKSQLVMCSTAALYIIILSVVKFNGGLLVYSIKNPI